jgi:sugar/nucleoside kinase (ribokinase family)
VNPIGAGDVLTAALAAALERGVSLLDAIREGVAAASAAVEHPVAGRFDAARMRELLAGSANSSR